MPTPRNSAGQEVVDADGQRHDVVDLLRARPAERRDVLLRHHRVVERVVLVVELDDRARQLRAFLDAEPRRQRARRDVAHDDLERNDLDFLDQLLAHVQPADEMRRHADVVEVLEDVFRDAVVQDALAVDHLMLLGVERGRIVLEVLDQRAGLGTFIQDLGLALVDAAAAVHGDQPWLEEIHGSAGAPSMRFHQPRSRVGTLVRRVAVRETTERDKSASLHRTNLSDCTAWHNLTRNAGSGCITLPKWEADPPAFNAATLRGAAVPVIEGLLRPCGCARPILVSRDGHDHLRPPRRSLREHVRARRGNAFPRRKRIATQASGPWIATVNGHTGEERDAYIADLVGYSRRQRAASKRCSIACARDLPASIRRRPDPRADGGSDGRIAGRSLKTA